MVALVQFWFFETVIVRQNSKTVRSCVSTPTPLIYLPQAHDPALIGGSSVERLSSQAACQIGCYRCARSLRREGGAVGAYGLCGPFHFRTQPTFYPPNPLADSARQVVDTGLDETSCFFIDDGGEEVDHGYYFEELFVGATSSSQLIYYPVGEEGDFTYTEERRKVIAAWKPLVFCPRRSPESALSQPGVDQ